MSRLFAIPIATALLAGCGSDGTDTASTTTVSASCPVLTQQAVSKIAGISTLDTTDLAPQPGTGESCGTVFFSGSGELVVQIQAVDGARSDLRGAARVASVSTGGTQAEQVRSIGGFGPGAFVVGDRVIGFLRDGRVVTVQTGYTAAGDLALRRAQLEAVARAAADSI